MFRAGSKSGSFSCAACSDLPLALHPCGSWGGFTVTCACPLRDRVGVPREGSGRRERLTQLFVLHDSAGGLRVPPKAPGCGAPRASSSLVLPEQHDREWGPARAQWERPHSGVSAVQVPPGADGLPAAGLGRRTAAASPQNPPGTLRHGIRGGSPKIAARGMAPHSNTASGQLTPPSAGWEAHLKWTSIIFILFYFYDGIISQSTFP